MNFQRTAECLQRLLAYSEPARGIGVILLGRQPRQHHGADVVKLNPITVVHHEQLSLPPPMANRESKLGGIEIVCVLECFEDALKWARTQRPRATSASRLACPKDRALLAD
jgi:hypothetical protein